jgi:glycosyltransferase involved in cell wall biosynthesis
MKLSVTAVIPVKNEAANLPRCLESLESFTQIVVVDSDSTDNSAQIARDFGAVVLDFHWDGRFPKKRNWCLRNHSFRTEWVLFLDADEVVTPEFIEELRQVIQQPRPNGYWVTYRNYFMGRLLRFGDKFRKLPLIRLGHGEFEHIDEQSWSHLDMEVHEHLVIDGPVGKIKSPLLHFDMKGLSSYFQRHNEYSSWEASRYLALEGSQRASLTWRQRLKYRFLNSLWFPPLYFLGSYLFKGGFLDGQAGFRFAISKMLYFYQVNFKIAEQRAATRGRSSDEPQRAMVAQERNSFSSLRKGSSDCLTTEVDRV